ncbi:glycoside hydrolase family 65 protein [Aquimarina addita]|uniref:Glycoside hydrolase family 65 protein n=1 Tax=Aquimarina addita TaxID=870485 RepID=A0ABP6UXD2_9FLAO
MHQDYIQPNEWSIIEEGFDPHRVKSSESLFSIGNGAMGQRANFEETYTGETFQGSYIAGVYYPDKTRVGWWKNGYPEYFAKVLNAPNWIGIDVKINGEVLDLHTSEVIHFRRELNMKEGWYKRNFTARLANGVDVKVEAIRMLSLQYDEVGAIRYSIMPVNTSADIQMTPYIDAGITNEDSNWDDTFWEVLETNTTMNSGSITTKTMKTDFHVCTGMYSTCTLGAEEKQCTASEQINRDNYIGLTYGLTVDQGKTCTVEKYAGYTVSLNHQKSAVTEASKKALFEASQLGFDQLIKTQAETWASIWNMADITITGDVKAQQGIRFNIFQLNQTYSGKDTRLNIGPKGFTGEKYGGSTYWDTEAYCLPFYMVTKNPEVARNLLTYRYHQLDKAIANAKKLGFTNGAALYPMVTMNGEECHNEWEITFEEIHRNGAMIFAIYNYVRYTGDYSYIPEKGLEVMIAVARFWHQRATFSEEKNKYVILGVTGPNEYENNINNNYYTNYLAKWCIEYCIEQIHKVKASYLTAYTRIWDTTKLTEEECIAWQKVASAMYFPYSEKYQVYLQQDGFLDKELTKVSELPDDQLPINQHWSWDRILRSPYIKQADVLQGIYMFEDRFTQKEIEKHFDFYEPLTVHESSLSPCVHSIIASKLDRIAEAYTFYVRTSRLDLDDYNKEVEEGCHITSMAGTWMSIVEGFAGMRITNDTLSFTPRIPEQWGEYSFKVNFRERILKISVVPDGVTIVLEKGQALAIQINGVLQTIEKSEVNYV